MPKQDISCKDAIESRGWINIASSNSNCSNVDNVIRHNIYQITDQGGFVPSSSSFVKSIICANKALKIAALQKKSRHVLG